MKNRTIMIIMFLCVIVIFGFILIKLNFDNTNTDVDITPMTPVFYPKDLKNWDPNNDENIKYNKADVELAQRQNMPKIEEGSNYDTKVMALSAMNPSTLGNIANGGEDFEIYNFSHWQYIDSLVMWGGSAGEGIIVPPSAYVTNAAHKNGVKSYGTIYFPPEVFGGQKEWVLDLLEKDDNGNYIIADKLILMSQEYNFDGWFINQETEGLSQEEAQDFENFLQYFNENSGDDVDLIWYDSMLENGEIDWQNELNDKNIPFIKNKEEKITDGMFLNFWWDDMTKTQKYAKEMDINPYDIYAGIDVEEKGVNTEVAWDGFLEDGSSKVSLGIYRPDTTFKNADSYENYEIAENEFWTGSQDKKNWPGISKIVVGKTPVLGNTFTTNFNTGNGKKYAVEGEIKSENSWNNLSLQDILPSWTFKIDGKNDIKASYDYENPYYGGSSLKLEGLAKDKNISTIDLYASNLQITKDSVFDIVYKQNAPLNIKLILTLNNKDEIEFDISDTKENEWINKSVDLLEYEGKDITKISISFSSNSNTDIVLNLGQMKFYEKKEENSLEKITNLDIKDFYSSDGLSANIKFDFDTKNDPSTIYEFYKVEEKEDQYLGTTLNDEFYVHNLQRLGAEETFKIRVDAVNLYGKVSSEEYEFKWPKYPSSKADFEVSKTYVQPGEEISMINKSSTVTTDYDWTFEGANTPTSSEKNPNISYENEGVYSITLTASNEFTSDTYELKDVIVVSDDAKDITNLTQKQGVSFEATGACSDTEQIQFAFDQNLETKWCDNSDELVKGFTIDLQQDYLITGFEFENASKGGESTDYNTKAYTIYTSEDGKNYQEVYKETNNILAEQYVAIVPNRARYVKVEFDEPTQNEEGVTRIYEFKVLGLN